jgi:hypothetical protein
MLNAPTATEPGGEGDAAVSKPASTLPTVEQRQNQEQQLYVAHVPASLALEFIRCFVPAKEASEELFKSGGERYDSDDNKFPGFLEENRK